MGVGSGASIGAPDRTPVDVGTRAGDHKSIVAVVVANLRPRLLPPFAFGEETILSWNGKEREGLGLGIHDQWR
ncbi:hypothetical protein CRG98_004334 [Punica granatum]|uniref:Uncharacterized protein n=1 Tax=Punica granatum TaxID=22663 RepID=A0A2I0L3N0_PUNGR|nr:hypothetical protein CRG98_004334 [Punica granatum]